MACVHPPSLRLARERLVGCLAGAGTCNRRTHRWNPSRWELMVFRAKSRALRLSFKGVMSFRCSSDSVCVTCTVIRA